MKKLAFKLTLVAAFALAAGTLAKAQVLISVNFQGGDTVGMDSTDITGAPGFVGGNWNNATDASGGPIALNDSNGSSSDVTLVAYAAGPFGVNGPDTANTTPQEKLFGGSLGVNFGPATFTVSGLSGFSSYDLIVYYTGGDSFSDTRQANITASGSGLTYYVAGDDSVYTDYTQSNSTDSATYASGNYVVFSGLTDSSETVSMNYVNNNMGLAGFQIEGVNAAPEPATWVLMLGGLAILMSVHRFRRQNFKV